MGISTVKKKKYFYSKNKGILLVSYNLDIMPNKFPDGHLSNLQKQKIITEIIITFINNLSLNLRDYLFIKTNIAYTSQDQNKGDIVKNQIIKNFQNINFIENKKLTHQISHDFSIQIETFLSTGFYEALYLNNPTILIFNPKTIDGVNKNFLKELNKMHSLKICFFNASEAAQFININFKHINKWWNSKAIQDFRKIFSNKYCSENKHFIKNLKKIINF
jgi:putative transferase (TIGR04331 family)